MRFQCRQTFGIIEVGYVRNINDTEVLVHKRNMTIGTGCLCMPLRVQRMQSVVDYGFQDFYNH